MNMFVVTMYRFADKERHSYVHGVFDNKKDALKSARGEQEHRGGNKYYPEVISFEVNKTKKRCVVLELGK